MWGLLIYTLDHNDGTFLEFETFFSHKYFIKAEGGIEPKLNILQLFKC